MQKYKSKPVIVEAVQLNWNTWNDVCDFIPKEAFDGGVYLEDGEPLDEGHSSDTIGLRMKTKRGLEIVQQGDYIVKDVDGSVRSCSPEKFEMLYEKL